jgi:amidase
MTNHANEAARYLGDRIAVASPLPLRRERYAARPWQAGAANYLSARIAKASEPGEALIEHPDNPLDESVRGPTEAALAALEQAGVAIDRTSDLLPDLSWQHAVYLKMMNVVMARGAPAPNGKRASASDWFDLLDAQAQAIARWETLFETYDFVLAPPAPVLAVPHRDEAVFRGTISINGLEQPGGNGLAWAGLATFPNLPATVLPIGSGNYLGADLPCGMQVIGPRWADLDCIAAAAEIGNLLHG